MAGNTQKYTIMMNHFYQTSLPYRTNRLPLAISFEQKMRNNDLAFLMNIIFMRKVRSSFLIFLIISHIMKDVDKLY